MWKEETYLKSEIADRKEALVNSRGERSILLEPELEEASGSVSFFSKSSRYYLFSTVSISVPTVRNLNIRPSIYCLQNDVSVCGTAYWMIFCLQLPVAMGVFGYEAVKLYKEYKKRSSVGNTECICEASIAWTPLNIAFCALCGILGGTVGGLLGSGGGFILGPLLLEIGVIPQVASATATFVMMFSSSLSVVEFYLLNRFPIPYAVYLMGVSVLAGFWGQYFVRKIVAFLGRASIIVFILSGVIFASALTMGVFGTEKSITMIHNHEFMGFLGFCSCQ
ncbi:unnamed protein product [Linum tenue]|uniref:Sulfite exporter TauE/SafE family protein n=2 Tax=Linum tenue TaxID=586396 RepID=A0AAV0PG57_9ROSI|nr:unnamed protein product [Linum tenue]